MVDIEVELLERRHEFRVLANLRTYWDSFTRGRLDEVPVWRHLGNEQVRWIGEAGSSKGEQRNRPEYHGQSENDTSRHRLHPSLNNPAICGQAIVSRLWALSQATLSHDRWWC